MVANHAHKKLARLIVEDSRGTVSYTEAMARSKRLHSVGENERAKRRLFTDMLIVERAGAILRSGRDLIVFGMTSTGKSSAAYSAIESSGLASLILEGDYRAAAFVRAVVDDSVTVRSFDAEPKSAERDIELVMADEILHERPLLEQQLKNAHRRVLVVHARNRDDALWRIDHLFPGLVLNSPAFLEGVLEDRISPRIPGRRSLRFYEE